MLKNKVLLTSLLGAALIAASPVAVSADEILARGTFTGASGHTTSGSVTIVKTASGVEVHLGTNFSLDSAPAPWVGFGNNGKYDEKSQFSKLGKKTGARVYKLPAAIDASRYNEFYVWCAPFGVPLGVAKLK